MSEAIAAPPRGGAFQKTFTPTLIAAAIGTTLLTLAGAAWAQDATPAASICAALPASAATPGAGRGSMMGGTMMGTASATMPRVAAWRSALPPG